MISVKYTQLLFWGIVFWGMVYPILPLLATKKINLIMIDGITGKKKLTIGDYYQQESPCSTFKIAISLMGFNTGILKNKKNPKIDYNQAFAADIDAWKNPQTPESWIKNSCVWYSQIVTSLLGKEKFKNYVQAFSYGNQDITGDHDNNNGLTQSWLCSSLKISPLEQVLFIKKLLNQELPVSDYAQNQTKKLLFLEDLSNDWKLYGKTGTGITQDSSIGWFVGWINNSQEGKTFIFACLLTSDNDSTMVTGYQAKKEVLAYIHNYLTEGEAWLADITAKNTIQ